MTRNVDSVVLDSRYRKRLQLEILQKGSFKASASKFRFGHPYLISVLCPVCNCDIELGARIHVQRNSNRVRVFHQACWDNYCYVDSEVVVIASDPVPGPGAADP